jgi:hypothetical protein
MSTSTTLDNATLYTLVRNLANANYNDAVDTMPLSIFRVQQGIIAAALQGQFAVTFEYPKTVSQSLLALEQGNVPDFDPNVLTYYRTATQTVYQAFAGSQFVVSSLQNASGFKVSWSQAQPATSN